MWTKLTHLVKSRGEGVANGPSLEGNNDAFIMPTNASSMTYAYDIPPNPFASDPRSIDHSMSPCTSPPGSPSKASKRSVFRRSLKAKVTSNPQAAGSMNKGISQIEASSFKLAPKKKRASLQLDTFIAQSSVNQPPNKSGSIIAPQTPTIDLSKPKDIFDPNVEVQPSGTGSIRSILRDKNTPGTGRSVRFFSRDAYHVISPDVSEMDTVENIPPNLNFENPLEKPERGPNSSQMGGSSTMYHSAFVSPQNNVEDIFSLPDTKHDTIRRNTGSGTPCAATSTPSSMTGPARTILSPEGMVFFTPDASDTAFFTPEPSALNSPSRRTVIPVPEDIEAYSHEELLCCVREQLSLQQLLASQFEIDLSARDELVSILSTKLQTSETTVEKYRKEIEKRQISMRALRHKVADLEKLCQGLEEEVERSREESFERSVMDEASEGALVVLHGSIGQLKSELQKAKEESLAIRQERDSVREDNVSLQAQLQESKQTLNEEYGRWTLAEESKKNLEAQLLSQNAKHDATSAVIEAVQRTIYEKEGEIKMLREELEAQWQNTEKADEKIKSLQGEKEGLAKSVQALEARVEELGAQWKDTDARRAELEEELNEARITIEEIEHERDQLADDVNFEREHAEQLLQSLAACENKVQELEQEQQYAADNIARLEELLRNRDSEIAVNQTQIVQREQEAEGLRAQISKINREHNRLVEEQTHNQNERTQQEEVVRLQLQTAVKQKAEGDVKIASIQEQLSFLNNDVERLRRQVHDLQQESADKEVKIVQLMKARTQDKEDKEGLNIALDSKQQELELLKRKLGVKGTAGATPATTRIGIDDTNARRHSLAFVTPSIRPKAGSTAAVSKSLLSNTPEITVKPKISVPRSTMSTAKTVRMAPPSRTTPLSVSTSTLTRSTSSLAKSSSSRSVSTRRRSGIPLTSGIHQRSPSVMSSSAASYTESEKENVAIEPSVKQRSMIPA